MLLQKSLVAVFSVLLLATIVLKLLILIRPHKDWHELSLRIRTWWIIIILFALALISPNWLALSFFALVSFIALKEYLTLVPARHADRMPILKLNYMCLVQGLCYHLHRNLKDYFS